MSDRGYLTPDRRVGEIHDRLLQHFQDDVSYQNQPSR
jgi:hypothetical protein